jgi:hypothetical protein
VRSSQSNAKPYTRSSSANYTPQMQAEMRKYAAELDSAAGSSAATPASSAVSVAVAVVAAAVGVTGQMPASKPTAADAATVDTNSWKAAKALENRTKAAKSEPADDDGFIEVLPTSELRPHTWVEAGIRVLLTTFKGQPTHYREILQEIGAHKLMASTSKTPEMTLVARLTEACKNSSCPVFRSERQAGHYALTSLHDARRFLRDRFPEAYISSRAHASTSSASLDALHKPASSARAQSIPASVRKDDDKSREHSTTGPLPSVVAQSAPAPDARAVFVDPTRSESLWSHLSVHNGTPSAGSSPYTSSDTSSSPGVSTSSETGSQQPSLYDGASTALIEASLEATRLSIPDITVSEAPA